MAFGRREEKETVSATQSIIGKDVVIKGEVSCEGVIRIEGSVEGNISGNGEITVAETGKVKGDITGRKVIVIGKVQGNITAKETVEVVSQAEVVGDIMGEKISIEEGAVIEGKCITKKPKLVEQPTIPKVEK